MGKPEDTNGGNQKIPIRYQRALYCLSFGRFFFWPLYCLSWLVFLWPVYCLSFYRFPLTIWLFVLLSFSIVHYIACPFVVFPLAIILCGNQKIPMVETRRYQWGNQKIPMGKPEDTNGGNQKIPMV
jgi:hypothetical protein